MHITNQENSSLIPGCRLKSIISKEERQAEKARKRLAKRIEQDRNMKARQREKLLSKSRNSAFHEKKSNNLSKNDLTLQTDVPKPRKPIKSRGTKGRTATVDEQKVMDAFGEIGCIACLMKGRYRPIISIHHIDGRTKKFAHYRTLPLCENHHDYPAEKEVLEEFPDLIPIHAKGTIGGKGEWCKQNGNEYDLLKVCYELAGIKPVDGVLIN